MANELEWDDVAQWMGVTLRACFFDADAVNARADATERLLPVFRMSKPQLLVTESDRRNFVVGNLIGQPDAVWSHGNGLISLEYKSNSGRPHDRQRWRSQLSLGAILQCIGGAMTVAGSYGKPTAAFLRVHNALYQLDPCSEVLECLAGSISHAKDYWREERRVNVTQLAGFCEARIRDRFRERDAERASMGVRAHEQMLRRS